MKNCPICKSPFVRNYERMRRWGHSYRRLSKIAFFRYHEKLSPLMFEEHFEGNHREVILDERRPKRIGRASR